MQTTRRGFLKASGAAIAMGGMSYALTSHSTAFANTTQAKDFKLVNTQEYTNVCCYCSGGCGSILSVRDGELIGLEGDSDHPINQGGLCPKGASMSQLRQVVTEDTYETVMSPARTTTPLVRRPFSDTWEEISWEDSISEVAAHVKRTRDENFIEVDSHGTTVNYTPAIGSLGGSQQNSEEGYFILKSMRSLGIVAIDNQARV